MQFVFGHSDDCIELRGDVYEEVYSSIGPNTINFVLAGGGQIEVELEYGPGDSYDWEFIVPENDLISVIPALGEDSGAEKLKILDETVPLYSQVLVIDAQVVTVKVNGIQV